MDRLLTARGCAASAFLALGAALAVAGPSAAGEAAHGKSVFTQQCVVCHSPAKGGPNIVGPDLFGVVGRPAGSLKGFSYSPAMKTAGFAWSPDRLHDYLAAPAKAVPGNRMPYAGVKDSAQLDDLVAYLQSLR